MGSPTVQFPGPSPPEETNQPLCLLVYFGRTREDFGQEKELGKVKVGEWGWMERRGQDGAEVCGGGGAGGGRGAMRAEPRWRSQSGFCYPSTQSSSCLSDCYRNPGSSRSKSQTNTGEAIAHQLPAVAVAHHEVKAAA